MAWLAEHFAGKEVTYTTYTVKASGTKLFPAWADWVWETRCRKCGQEVLLYRQGCLACALKKTGECTDKIPGEIINNYRCDRWAYEDEDCEKSNRWRKEIQERYPDHFTQIRQEKEGE
jgi:hypothetical protein